MVVVKLREKEKKKKEKTQKSCDLPPALESLSPLLLSQPALVLISSFLQYLSTAPLLSSSSSSSSEVRQHSRAPQLLMGSSPAQPLPHTQGSVSAHPEISAEPGLSCSLPQGFGTAPDKDVRHAAIVLFTRGLSLTSAFCTEAVSSPGREQRTS